MYKSSNNNLIDNTTTEDNFILIPSDDELSKYYEESFNYVIFEKKYKLHNETIHDMFKRVAYNQAQFKLMQKKIFMPAGRHLTGRNNPEEKTLFNCYVTAYLEDSMKAINELEGRSDRISSKGGGIGINFSILRPEDSSKHSYKNSCSSGAVSFIKRFAYSQSIITQGGSRRGALIGIMFDSHPDIIKFISMKSDLKEITNMNISPMITDKFMHAVENNLNWDLVFPDLDKVDRITYKKYWNGDISYWKSLGLPIKIHETIKAKDLWDLIIEHAWTTGEPGVLFYDNINNTSNIKHYEKIITTNPCFTGETIVATADGRNGVRIDELAKENKPFLVYSARKNKIRNKWKTEIKQATAFKTGTKEVILLTLSDNTKFKCTQEHKLGLEDGISYIEAKDSLKMYLEKFYTYTDIKKKKQYRIINSKSNGYNRQHKMIYSYYNVLNSGEKLNVNYINEYSTDNNINVDFSERVYVKSIDYTNEFVDVYDLNVEDNHNFYIITKTNDEKYMNCSGILVHNCGEQILPLGKNKAGSSCNLGSINFKELYDETKKEDNYINYDLLDYAIKHSIDYLDASIDAEKYFDSAIEENQKFFRQIGLGIMGYADLLIKLGIRYGSDEAIVVTEKIMQFMLDKSYKYSALLAKEHGCAPVWNEVEMNDYYLQQCSAETIELVKKYKLRNSAVLSIAPTGSISMLCNVNGGLEPYFRFEYIRTDVLGERLIIADIVKEAKIPENSLTTTNMVTPREHIKVQSTFQKYTDASISKTINLPENATLNDVHEAFMLAYKSGIKGTTVYRDKCREGVLKEVPSKQNNLVYNNSALSHDSLITKDNLHENYDLYDMYTKMGNNPITKGIKPPKYSFLKKVKISNGKKYYFFVGYLTEDFKIPYEFYIISNAYEKTHIVDELIDDINTLLKKYNIDEDLIDLMKNKMIHQNNIDKIARLISMALRHNIDLRELCNILEKYTKSISSLLYSIRKTLMKLIPDGTITTNAERCSECGNELIYSNGCISCIDISNCGYSKC